MKYSIKNINNIKINLNKDDFIDKCRNSKEYFRRKRKVSPKDIILYELNKKGLSTKMEILNFNNINDVKEISAPGFFKQREKLNPQAFAYLIQDSLRLFYNEYKDEVKTYKGYVLLAIDESDFEIPNTKITREIYNGKQQKHPARITVSTCYDVLNKYTIDTIIEKYDFSEQQMAINHCKTIKEEKILGNFKSIKIMDRNYRNLSHMYNYINEEEKFLLRIPNYVYKDEQDKIKTNDGIIELGFKYDRLQYYKKTDPELYKYLESGNTIKVRCVKIELETGETEVLLTNLEQENFTTEEIKELYNKRWKTEINYKHLKNNLKIESISSGKEILIKQDILSQILVSNMLQAFINEREEEIEQEKYKNKMKINNNMSVGIFKNSMIYILLEENGRKREQMMDKLGEALKRYIVPIKTNRKNERTNNPKNRYHTNQRKTF